MRPYSSAIIYILDGNLALLRAIAALLKFEIDCNVVSFVSNDKILLAVRGSKPDLLIVGKIDVDHYKSVERIHRLRRDCPRVPLILLCDDQSPVPEASAVLRRTPVDATTLLSCIVSLIAKREQVADGETRHTRRPL